MHPIRSPVRLFVLKTTTTSHDLYLVEARSPHSQLLCHITKHAQVLQTLKMLQISLIKAIPKSRFKGWMKSASKTASGNLLRINPLRESVHKIFLHHLLAIMLFQTCSLYVEELFLSLQMSFHLCGQNNSKYLCFGTNEGEQMMTVCSFLAERSLREIQLKKTNTV